MRASASFAIRQRKTVTAEAGNPHPFRCITVSLEPVMPEGRHGARREVDSFGGQRRQVRIAYVEPSGS